MYILIDEFLYYAFLTAKQNLYPVKNYILFPQYVRKINPKEMTIYV